MSSPDDPATESASVAVASPDAPPKARPDRARPTRDPKNQPRRQPPYAVVIFNDPVHSFAYVIELLQRVFGYNRVKAARLTFQAHRSDRAVVWTGPLETAEFKRDRIRGFGPDTYSLLPVTTPLGCCIEPLAE